MKVNMLSRLLCAALWMATTVAYAGNVSIQNRFTAGTPARASEVNANFNAFETAVDDNDARITGNSGQIATLQTLISTLQSTVTQLQNDLTQANSTIISLQTALAGKSDVGHLHAGTYAPVTHGHVLGDITNLMSSLNTHSSQISAINNSEVMSLDPYLTVASDSRGPMVTFSGVNLQVVNGTGTTYGNPNGLGNLLIGYDRVDTSGIYKCSYGTHAMSLGMLIRTENDCLFAGGIWAVSHKNGSHYLVVGDENNYSQYGGLVAGWRNTSNQINASVTGGSNNAASGTYSNVSGGYYNIAGDYASISGGYGNTAEGKWSSVSGGYGNNASMFYSSIGGGSNNTASGTYSSVNGGRDNTASGGYSSVAGGQYNTASGTNSSITAGYHNTASGMGSSITGGRDNTASGDGSDLTVDYNVISGGNSRSVTGSYDWAAGALWQDY